jgi:hypothetical protein
MLHLNFQDMASYVADLRDNTLALRRQLRNSEADKEELHTNLHASLAQGSCLKNAHARLSGMLKSGVLWQDEACETLESVCLSQALEIETLRRSLTEAKHPSSGDTLGRISVACSPAQNTLTDQSTSQAMYKPNSSIDRKLNNLAGASSIIRKNRQSKTPSRHTLTEMSSNFNSFKHVVRFPLAKDYFQACHLSPFPISFFARQTGRSPA